MTKLQQLQEFRHAFYQRLGPARDALFELCDATLATAKPPSFAHLALSPLFRRRWPSLYEALQDGRPDSAGLMNLILDHVPDMALERPLLVGDHTAWPRLSARTLPERLYTHHADKQTRIADGLPITAGFAFSTLALLPDSDTRWVLPLVHERIVPEKKAYQVAAEQLRMVALEFQRRGAGRALTLLDSQYGCAPFLKATAPVAVDLLFRLRSNRVLWGVPPAYSGRGAPCIHGDKFKLNAPETWPEADEVLVVEDERLGLVEIRRWVKWHMRKAPDREMTLIRVDCLDKPKKKAMWLGFLGEQEPSLSQVWRLYLRRFSIEHWYRFSKQRLHWTLPRLSTPEQHERWSALMPVLTMQLYLARSVMIDHVLPWQKPQPVARRTPGRVCQGMAGLIAVIDTPACAPKPRGKSPGWEPGRVRSRRGRHRIMKKGRKRKLKRRRQAA